MTAPEDLKPGTWYTILYLNAAEERRCVRGQFIECTLSREKWIQEAQILLYWFLFPVYRQSDGPSLKDHKSFFSYRDFVCIWEEPA